MPGSSYLHKNVVWCSLFDGHTAVSITICDGLSAVGTFTLLSTVAHCVLSGGGCIINAFLVVDMATFIYDYSCLTSRLLGGLCKHANKHRKVYVR